MQLREITLFCQSAACNEVGLWGHAFEGRRGSFRTAHRTAQVNVLLSDSTQFRLTKLERCLLPGAEKVC